MAHVQDLWEKTVTGRRVRTSRYRKGHRWQARYLDPEGRERTRTFVRKQDAERFVVTVGADVLRGAYVDPHAGKVTFAEFAERWLAAQTFTESSREATELRLRARLPKREQRKVEPWPVEQVEAVIDALPERYRGVGVVASGCWLRLGEAFGLRFRDVDFLRRQVHVEQQVKIVRSRLVLEHRRERRRAPSRCPTSLPPSWPSTSVETR